MRKNNGFTVSGIDDVNKILGTIAPKHAKNLARASVHAVASEIAKEAKKRAPKDSGVLKKSIKAQRRKSPAFQPRSDVIVKGGRGGAWYWRFIEFGTLNKSETPFFMPVYNEYKEKANRIFTEKFIDKLIKKLERERKR